MALAVIRDGEIVYEQGYGLANLEYDIPVTASTVFHVASVSKQFTALAIHLLAHAGQLSLDDDIRTYLPEVPEFGHKITVRHLLHHTSGLRDQWELLVMAGWRMDDVITLDQIMKLVRRQQELNFAPGDEYLYSNTGFTLLAEIVARVSGQSFRQFTHERIFQPLQMASTHFHDDHQEIVKNRAYSYSPDYRRRRGYRNSVLSYANVGATSLFTTAHDLARYLLNFDKGVVGGREVLEAMQQPYTLNNGVQVEYASGLRCSQYRGLSVVGHSGSDAGYRTWCGRFPEQRLGIVVLANVSTALPQALAMQVAEVFLGDQMQAPEQPTEQQATAGDPSELAGKYRLTFTGEEASVSVEGDRPHLTIEGEPPLALDKVAVDKYQSQDRKATVEFRREDERVVGCRVTLQDLVLPANRLPEQPAVSVLAGYVGDYYSPELDVTYRVRLKDGGLVLEQHRHPDTLLYLVEEDQLRGNEWYLGELRMTRDADSGQISGFRLSGNRVRNLAFVRRA